MRPRSFPKITFDFIINELDYGLYLVTSNFLFLRVGKFRPCHRQPYNMVFIPSVSPYVQRQYRNRSHLTRLWVSHSPNEPIFK